MHNILSFYSFKHTNDTHSHRPFRKDHNSNFQDFQYRRLQQQMIAPSPPKKRSKAKSHQLLVRSKEEGELLTFLKTPDLPKIALKSPKTKKSHCQQNRHFPQSPLEKILGNKKKFMRTYFKDLREVKGSSMEEVRHVFEVVKVGDWAIRGYLRGEHLILRGVNQEGRQRYVKYKYQKYMELIKTNYEEFVIDAVQAHLLKQND